MAKKKINTQIKMRVVLVSLEFALAVSPIDCFYQSKHKKNQANKSH